MYKYIVFFCWNKLVFIVNYLFVNIIVFKKLMCPLYL